MIIRENFPQKTDRTMVSPRNNDKVAIVDNRKEFAMQSELMQNIRSYDKIAQFSSLGPDMDSYLNFAKTTKFGKTRKPQQITMDVPDEDDSFYSKFNCKINPNIRIVNHSTDHYTVGENFDKVTSDWLKDKGMLKGTGLNYVKVREFILGNVSMEFGSDFDYTFHIAYGKEWKICGRLTGDSRNQSKQQLIINHIGPFGYQKSKKMIKEAEEAMAPPTSYSVK